MTQLRVKKQVNRVNYVFNADLLDHLEPAIGLKKVRVAEICEVRRSVFTRWCKTSNLPMWALLRICNETGIRPSSFIGLSDGGIQRFNPIPRKRRTFNFTFNHQQLSVRFGTEISWNFVQERLGCNFNSLKCWASQKADIKDIIRICNSLRWNIGDFIDDDSIPKLPDTMLTRTELLIRIANLEDQLRELRSQRTYPDTYQDMLIASLKIAEDNQPSHS